MTQPAPNPTPGDPTPPAPNNPPAPAPAPTPPAPAPEPPKPADPPKPEDALGDAGRKALAEERAARQALEKRFSALAAALGDGDKAKGKTDVELLNERFAQHEKDLADERAARWRAEIAHEKGLTAKQANRLRGNTREELLADADDLLASFPAPAAPPVPGTPPGQPAPPVPQPDPSQGSRNSPPPRAKSLSEAVTAALKAK